MFGYRGWAPHAAAFAVASASSFAMPPCRYVRSMSSELYRRIRHTSPGGPGASRQHERPVVFTPVRLRDQFWESDHRLAQRCRFGYLSGWSPGDAADYVASFSQGLAETGYVEGKNGAIEYRWAEGHFDRLPALVADLVGRQVTVIVTANTTASALAAKAETQTIPIVFLLGSNPIEIIERLNRDFNAGLEDAAAQARLAELATQPRALRPAVRQLRSGRNRRSA
jgi:hypothetical protein